MGLAFFVPTKNERAGAHRLAVLVVGNAIVWLMCKNAVMAATGRY